MNICDYIQIGSATDGDLALSVERRQGRMPVSTVRVSEIDGVSHLAWVCADGEEEGVSLGAGGDLLARVCSPSGFILVEFDEGGGLIESSAQVVRAVESSAYRERCNV